MIDIKESYQVIDKGADFILKQVGKIGDGIEITSGIHAENFDKKPPGSKISVGIYAALNEYGTKTIPSRPFMRNSMSSNTELFVKQTISGMRAIYRGSLTMEALVSRQRVRVRKYMRNSIKNWSNPPNTRLLAIKKRRRGSVGTPLRDTDTLYRSITAKDRYMGGGLPPRFSRLISVAERRMGREALARL